MKKARKWLDEQSVEHEFHDYKKVDIDEITLRSWIKNVGWEVLLNRRGMMWRKVPQEIRESIDENIAISLMLDIPSIIKRPVLIIGAHIEVGFKPEKYEAIFNTYPEITA